MLNINISNQAYSTTSRPQIFALHSDTNEHQICKLSENSKPSRTERVQQPRKKHNFSQIWRSLPWMFVLHSPIVLTLFRWLSLKWIFSHAKFRPTVHSIIQDKG